MKNKIIASGLILAISGVWGGGYLIHLSRDAWWEMPTIMSTACIIVLGIFLTAYALIEMK